MTLKFTKHAEDMLEERQIDRSLVEAVIRRPDWTENAENEIWYAFKRVGPKVLRIIVKGAKEPFTVITLYYDRRLRR
jgi:hypothetical protein